MESIGNFVIDNHVVLAAYLSLLISIAQFSEFAGKLKGMHNFNSTEEPKIIATQEDRILKDLDDEIKQGNLDEDKIEIYESRISMMPNWRQKNLLAILKKVSGSNVGTNAASAKFLRHFIDYASLESEKELQSIWSKILEAESNSPGSVSIKTINLVSQIDKDMAVRFSRFAKYVVAHEYMPTRTKEWMDIDYSDIIKLKNAGLISVEDYGYTFNEVCKGTHSSHGVDFRHCSKLLLANSKVLHISGDEERTLNVTPLSQYGIELYKALLSKESIEFSDKYATELKSYFENQGFKVSITNQDITKS